MSTVGHATLEDAPLFFSPKRKRCAADYLPHNSNINNNSNNNNNAHTNAHAETAMKSFHHPTSSSSLLRTAGSAATHTLSYAYTTGSASASDASSLCTEDGQSRLCNQSALSVSLSLSAASLATQPEREREREAESETTMAISLDDSEAAFFSPHVHVRTQPLHKQAHHRTVELANTSVDSVGAYSGFRPAALFASHHTTRAHNKSAHDKAHLRDVVRAKIFDDDDEDNDEGLTKEQEQRDKHMSEDEYEHEYKHKHTHSHTHTLPFTPERALLSQRHPRSPQHGLGFAEEYAEEGEYEEPLPAWLQRTEGEGEEEIGEGDADEHIERLLSQSDSSFDRQLMNIDNNTNSNNNSVCLTHTAHTPVFPHSLSRSHSYTNTLIQCPQTALRSVNRQRSQSELAQQHHWLTENVSNFTRSCDLSVSQSLTQTHSQTQTPVKKTKPRRASFNTTRAHAHKHTHHHHSHTRVQALFPNSLPATPVRASTNVGEQEREPLLCDLGTPLTERGSPVVLLEGEGLDDDPAENESNTNNNNYNGESLYAVHTPFTPYAPHTAHTQRPVSLLTLGISRASSREERERDSLSERETARDSESSCVSLLLSPVRFCDHTYADTHAQGPDSVDKPLAKIRRRSKIFESPSRNNRSSSNNNSNNCSGYGGAFAPQQNMNNASGTALFPDAEREREKEKESSFLNSSLSSAASSLSSSSSLLLRPLPDPAAFDHEVTTKLNSSLEHKNSFNGNGIVLGAASPVCPATPSRTPGWKETRRLGRSNSNNNSSYNTSYSSGCSDSSNGSCSPENNSSEDLFASFGMSPLPTQSYKHSHTHSHAHTHANSLAAMPRPPLHRHNSLADNKLLVSQCDSPTRSGGISDAVVFHRDFAVEDMIGTGTFAEVYKVRSLSAVSAACPKLFPAQRQREGEATAPVYFAVKKIKRQFRSRKDRDWLLNEVLVMKRVNQTPCPYIIPFVRAWQEDNHFFVQLGLAEKGTLKELAQTFVHRRETMPTNTLWHVMHDVAAGLAHIHACNIVHLDIKPANILIKGNGRLQIGDFGMASELGSKDDSHEGDTRYMAPELLNISERLPSADIFSLALTVYELCYTKEQIERGTLLLPTEGPLWHKLREGDSDPVKHRPAELVALIKHMLRPDPASRPSAAEIVALPQVMAMAEDDDEALMNAQPPMVHRPQANRHSGAFFPILRQPSINEAEQAAYMAELFARAITPH